MKEKITEYEEVEREIERVYCDKCGDECTDSHRIEPSEVCKSCSSKPWYISINNFRSVEIEPASKDMNLFSAAMMAFISPLVLALSLMDAITGDGLMERENALFLCGTAIGIGLWVLAITTAVMG